jgi:hypothetical protein
VQRSDESRRLDDRDVAGLEEAARRQVESLPGARRHDDLVRVRRVTGLAPARGDLLAQRRQALRRQVVERLAATPLEHVSGDPGELLRRVQRRRGEAG